jgi:hypothetical protein
MSIKVRSRIETLAERLVRRTRITCSEMPQALTEKQLHLLRFIVVHGRAPGGITQLQSMLGLVEQGFNALAAPLYERKLIERVSLKELRQKAAGSRTPKFRSRTASSKSSMAPNATGSSSCYPRRRATEAATEQEPLRVRS